MKNKIALCLILAFILASLTGFAFAQESGDLKLSGYELEKLLNLGSALLSMGLFAATFLAYRRTGNKRLIYVSIAFLLFAVRGFLTSRELFFQDWTWADPTASFLNFVIILSFFIGVMKK